MNDNNQISTVTLSKWWFGSEHSENEKREVFLYIDFAMKYVHNRGYCVKTFDPKEIEILNNSINQIKFNTLLKMPDDNSYKKRLTNEDVFNSALLQIGLYSLSEKNFYNINANFVKENFEKFTPFLPETDVPYYRGIIERGASVYFTDFELERIKRENANLEKELNEIASKDDKMVKFSADYANRSLMYSNDDINNVIYKQLNKNIIKNGAFLNIFVYPMIFIILIVVFIILVFACDLFSV